MKKRVVFVFLLLVVLGGVWLWCCHRGWGEGALVLYGNVDIRQVSLAFDANGRIVSLLKEEGDLVKTGDVLGKLDTRTLELQAKRAEADVAAQQQTVRRLRNGSRPEEIAEVEARLASALSDLQRAEADLARKTQLHQARAVSVQDVDRARNDMEVARARVEEVRAALRLIRIGPREEEIAAAEAQLAAAEAQLELLRHEIEKGTLRSPSDGVIRSRLLEPGDMASPQKPVYTIALTQPKWIRVFVHEPELGRVRPGMKARVVADGKPEAPIEGKVGYISSVAEFTPKSVQTEELRTHLVYEVRVLVEDPKDSLRLGQPVTVYLAESL